MNDLAEQALRGLDLARKQIVKHPLTTCATAGLVLSAVIVFTGGRIASGSAATPLNGWLGLLPDDGTASTRLAAAIMLAAIVALLLLWLVVLATVRRGSCTERQVWTLSAFWAAPFVVGPPVLSSDIYTYVGQGTLAHVGADPYRVGPIHLGTVPVVEAMDPAWRASASTAGPLATFVEHLVVDVAGGNAFGAVLLFRALGLCCVIAIARLAANLSGPYRPQALAVTALNPALLLFVLSGFHFDGAVAALVLGALLATTQRRHALAVVLACVAGALRPAALAVVPLILVAHAIGPLGRASWRVITRDVLAALVTLAAATFVVPDGFGWRRNLSTVTLDHTPFAPATIVANVVRPIVPAASVDDLAIGGRIAVVLAAIGVVVYLLAAVRRRPLNRTAGYALLAVGLSNPVLYPWSLVAGICCLAPAAEGVRRDWVVALSCAACVLAPAGLHSDAATGVTLVALALIAVGLAVALNLHQRLRRRVSVG